MWDEDDSINIYELSENGIQALDNGNFEEYMNERFGICVGNHSTWYVTPYKPKVKTYRRKV